MGQALIRVSHKKNKGSIILIILTYFFKKTR